MRYVERAIDVPIDLQGRAIVLEGSMADDAVVALKSDQFHFEGERMRAETSEVMGGWLSFFVGKWVGRFEGPWWMRW